MKTYRYLVWHKYKATVYLIDTIHLKRLIEDLVSGNSLVTDLSFLQFAHFAYTLDRPRGTIIKNRITLECNCPLETHHYQMVQRYMVEYDSH